MIEVALGFQVLVWLVVLGVFLASGQATIFHPLGVYWGFHGLVFVIRPLLVHFMGFNSVFYYMGFNPSPQEFITTLAVTSLGMVVLATTCLWFGRVRPGFTGPAPALPPDQSRALPITTLLLLPVIAYSIYRAAGDTGGERAANGIYILTKTTGYVIDAQFMVAPLICLWLVKTRFHWVNLVPILLYVGYRSWVGSARWTFLLFFITLVFQYCWYRRLRWLPAWTLVIAVPVLILFNVVGQNRDLVKDYVNEGTLDQEQFGHTPGQSAVDKRKSQLDTQDFANFDYLAAVISIVPDRTGTYNYGLQYLQLFTEPIPRILWTGKPTGAPVGLVDISPYVNFLGLTFSLVGDGWVSGGWVGVIITMGIVGILLGLAHRFFWTHTNQVLPSLFFIGLLSVSPNWFRDGGISVFKFLLWTWAPFIILPVVTWLITSRSVPGTSITIRPGERLRIVRPAHQ
jgi:hypothetical protein